MVYNPARTNQQKKARKAPDPHAGTKHSDIMRRAGVGLTAPVASPKEKTRHGFTAAIFSSPNFVVRHETMFAGNNTGLVVSEDGDRTIRVLRGSIFVFFEDDAGQKIQYQIRADQHLHAPSGVKYGYATSGTEDVELLFIETKDYQVIELEEPTIRTVNDAVVATPESAIPPRRKESPAKEQAVAMARARRRSGTSKVVSPQNINSANMPGVNLRPMGPAAFEE